MMPSTQPSTRGGDMVRGRDGTTCTQGSHLGPTLDIGVTGSNNSNNQISGNFGQQNPTININTNSTEQASSNNGDYGVYARVVIPLDFEDQNRVDCTQLYNLEIERLTIELENLKKSGASAVTVE